MQAGLNDMDGKIVESFSYYDEFGRTVSCHVGDNDITEIKYHAPYGDGDEHFIDIYSNDGMCIRKFDFIGILFVEKDNSDESVSVQ